MENAMTKPGFRAVALATALGWCVFPFIIPDLAKMALAILISGRVRKYLH